MRLIDADALGIGMCNPDVFPYENMLYAKGWNQAIKILQKAPTVDAVEVVRCGDCKYFNFDIWSGRCRYGGRRMDVDDYCSRGERREDDAID